MRWFWPGFLAFIAVVSVHKYLQLEDLIDKGIDSGGITLQILGIQLVEHVSAVDVSMYANGFLALGIVMGLFAIALGSYYIYKGIKEKEADQMEKQVK
ncbi:hypothetical protein [Mechercharimyces sp. CAU 1602]|uniref:hypothetical protein n=1 Tax=Mechercharimyces sp. CAU 1602 TaxID=2973933 RepID=UPI0021627E7B|nr:hypothetical protein [Mechercharimyces sp. CAU 1602]MCS1350666.1 hypothetical protein [Mechercharimyces sp. CAU 1602]